MAQLARRGGFLAVAALAGVLTATGTDCESKSLRPPGSAGGSGGTSRPSERDASTDAGKQAAADASVDHHTASGVCANGAVTGAYTCNDEGMCQPGPTIVCAPYGCDPVTNQCRTACEDDGQCSQGYLCQSGSCVRDGAHGGGICGADADCLSGHCTDGVCCDLACSGPCVSCSQPGRLGACSPVPAGTPDPRGLCVDRGPSSCGQNGTCDGEGGCSLYAAGVSCAATSSCSGTLWSGPGTCSGKGTCERQMIPCVPYACDPQTDGCHSSCATAADCAPGTPCVNGACGTFQLTACSVNAECVSGFCAQGVCCATSCDGPCFSCALPGTVGTCTPVPNPPDAGACAP